MSSFPPLLPSGPLKSGCSLHLSVRARPQDTPSHTPAGTPQQSLPAALPSRLPNGLHIKTKPSPGSRAARPLPVAPPPAHSRSPCTCCSRPISGALHSHLRQDTCTCRSLPLGCSFLTEQMMAHRSFLNLWTTFFGKAFLITSPLRTGPSAPFGLCCDKS